MAKKSGKATIVVERALSASGAAAIAPFANETTLLGRICGDIVGDFQSRARRGESQRSLSYILDYVRSWPAIQAAIIKADLA